MCASKQQIRLDRFLSQATGLSRKQAGIEIRKRRVRVGEDLVRDPARHVAVDATVYWRDEPIAVPDGIYLMMHKPVGLVCARRDPLHSTVLDLLPPELAAQVHIVGRLDRETTGLLLLTDDGDWSHRLTSPRHGCAKTYLVDLAEPLPPDAERRFAQGLMLRSEKRPTRPARLERLSGRRVRVTLHEGRYHQVRRMFAALGNRVLSLHRESIGGVVLDAALPPGGWRSLGESELASLGAEATDQGVKE